MPSQILANATVNWKTPYSDEVWEKLEGVTTLDEEEFFSLGPTFPKEEELERRSAVVGVHRHEDTNELHWVLSVQAAPSDEPPAHIKERDEKLGGRGGRGARLEQIGYRFEGGGAGGIEEVVLIYEHLYGRYRANISATGLLKLNSPTWLPFADDIAELVSHTFFAPKEMKP